MKSYQLPIVMLCHCGATTRDLRVRLAMGFPVGPSMVECKKCGCRQILLRWDQELDDVEWAFPADKSGERACTGQLERMARQDETPGA